jgi:hypothetical protein
MKLQPSYISFFWIGIEIYSLKGTIEVVKLSIDKDITKGEGPCTS